MTSKVKQINGFYFSAKYPGDNSAFVDSDDVELCVAATKLCKQEIDRIIAEKEKQTELQNQKSEDTANMVLSGEYDKKFWDKKSAEKNVEKIKMNDSTKR